MSQTFWDIYYWIDFQVIENHIPTKKEIIERYLNKGYEIEVINKGISFYNEISENKIQ